MGWGGDTGGGANTGTDNRVHFLRGIFTTTEIYQGADDDTNHILQKTISFNKEKEIATMSTPTYLQYGPQTGGSFTIGRFKGVKIVTANK